VTSATRFTGRGQRHRNDKNAALSIVFFASPDALWSTAQHLSSSLKGKLNAD
jgi:hypothetical protein